MISVTPANAPKPIGPYSDAVKSGSLLFCSGQTPADPATGKIAGPTIEEQAKQSCLNVKALVEAAGSSMEKVVKTTCFLSDIKDFGRFNKIYAEYFISKPARSCFAVKDLPGGALCEIEAIAEL
ncbi:MAG: Rid family detoxifying hydrolase [Eubacterium sp.]|nr:Rid family detoxifying hydrolase [Eubacterium sp.]